MDSDMFDGLAEFFQWLMVLVVIMFITLIIIGVRALVVDDVIVTNENIKPEIRLVTDGKTIDTLYIYKNK